MNRSVVLKGLAWTAGCAALGAATIVGGRVVARILILMIRDDSSSLFTATCMDCPSILGDAILGAILGVSFMCAILALPRRV